jgi:hypothetical protein
MRAFQHAIDHAHHQQNHARKRGCASTSLAKCQERFQFSGGAKTSSLARTEPFFAEMFHPHALARNLVDTARAVLTISVSFLGISPILSDTGVAMAR